MMRSCLALSGVLVLFEVVLLSSEQSSWLVCLSCLGSDFSEILLFFDSSGVLFGSVVSFIIFQVYTYSQGYMKEDNTSLFFFLPLSLFSGSMLLLIFSGSLSTLFLAWDGLGVSSFLLVCHYSKASSAGASLITIFTNRVGDACLLLGLGVVGFEIISLDNSITCMLFIVAAFSKSAQWPLSAWLPAAMAAPTPVSALVHSSTLVTAGVYLLMRFESCYSGSLISFCCLAEITFFLSCLSACSSYDIKHIIAMSTLGHLSLMMLSLASGYTSITLFHLASHALFKALTFLAAGNMIVCCGHSQDLRLMGGVGQKAPVSSLCFFFSVLSLSGFWFTSAFYSKDLILEAMGQQSSLSFGFLGSSIASFYAGGYTSNLFDDISMEESNPVSSENLEKSTFFLGPLLSLMVLSLFSGWYLSKALFPASSVLVSGSSDIMFFIGVLSGGSDCESTDKSGEDSLFFLVEGSASVKVMFWQEVLVFCKEVEHGSFEWLGGVMGYLESMQGLALKGKGVFEW